MPRPTFGTGCFVYVNAGTHAPASTHGTLATIAWRRGDAVTYALDGGVLAAGALVTWPCAIDSGYCAMSKKLEAMLAGALLDAGAVLCAGARRLGRAALGSSRRAQRCLAWIFRWIARRSCAAVFRGLVCRVAEVVDARNARRK